MFITEAFLLSSKTGGTLDDTVDCLDPLPTNQRKPPQKRPNKLPSLVLKNGAASKTLPTNKHDKPCRGSTNKKNLAKNPATNK
jgi:hypothetical protein